MSVTHHRFALSGIGALVALIGFIACSETSLISSPTPFIDDVNPPSPGKEPPPPDTDGLFASPCPGYDPPPSGGSCNFGFTSQWDGTCEFGHDLDSQCNQIYKCTGTWTREDLNDCFDRCPDAFSKITPGELCTDLGSRSPLVSPIGCSYFEGTCACVPDGTTVPRDAGSADGGNGDAGTVPAGHWRCVPPPTQGCPAQRPQLGGDCVRPMTCDYGSCTLKRDLTFACENRIWIQTSANCEP